MTDALSLAPTLRASLAGVHEGVLHLPRGALVADTFQIGDVLGWGGMGVVYEAVDVRLQRKVALKMSLEPNDQALRTEARALAMLQHPGIAAVHWMGVHEDRDFFVMERVYGKTLADHLYAREASGRPLDLFEAVRVLRGVAEALVAVHDRGIVHHDVKPANVMLAPNNRVVLMDFGLLSAGEVVHPEGLCGTFEYLAPELIGQDETARGAADIYALGCVAFEILAGRVPFDGALINILSRHMTEAVPDVRTFAVEVPEPLAQLVAEMLSKDPDLRPDARAVAHRLGRLSQQPQPADAFRVLVVDDEPTVNKMLALTIGSRVPGCTVVTAFDGKQALERIHTAGFDVMVLDLHMPTMSGVEVCMHLRGLDVPTEVVAVSAGAQQADVDVLARLGVHRFEQKGAGFLERVCEHVRNLRAARWRG